MAAVLMAAAVCTAVTTYNLQLHLEAWDYERHVDD